MDRFDKWAWLRNIGEIAKTVSSGEGFKYLLVKVTDPHREPHTAYYVVTERDGEWRTHSGPFTRLEAVQKIRSGRKFLRANPAPKVKGRSRGSRR